MSNKNQYIQDLAENITKQSLIIKNIDCEIKTHSDLSKNCEERTKTEKNYSKLLKVIQPALLELRPIELDSFTIGLEKKENTYSGHRHDYFIVDKKSKTKNGALELITKVIATIFTGIIFGCMIYSFLIKNIPENISSLLFCGSIVMLTVPFFLLIIAYRFKSIDFELRSLEIYHIKERDNICAYIAKYSEKEDRFLNNTLLTETQLNLFKTELEEYLESKSTSMNLMLIQKKDLLHEMSHPVRRICKNDTNEKDFFCSQCGTKLNEQ